ncbi:MAG: hypothetical protein MUE50_00085 [Pirellulaceae bacterium]|jgi:hypothetical protein|nr:hypothetical protein [Pirellulaceae bacterium]
MSEFKNTRGETIRLTLTIGKARKIKDRLGLDLLAVGDVRQSPLVKLADDPQMLCELLWALVNPEWPDKVGDEQAFWDSVDDATLEAATAAITEALLAFFRPGRRAIVQAAMDLQTKTEQRLACQLNQLASDDGAVDAAAGQLLQHVKSNLQTLGT